MTVHHTASAASTAQLAQPSQPLPAAVCRACSVHASTGAPHPTWSPRALTTSRGAADQAPRSQCEADLRGADARGLSYYLYIGSETFSTGHSGLRWPRGNGRGTDACSEFWTSPVNLALWASQTCSSVERARDSRGDSWMFALDRSEA